MTSLIPLAEFGSLLESTEPCLSQMMPHLVVEVWGVDQMMVKVAFGTVVSMDDNRADHDKSVIGEIVVVGQHVTVGAEKREDSGKLDVFSFTK
jgi:hypothetical protein